MAPCPGFDARALPGVPRKKIAALTRAMRSIGDVSKVKHKITVSLINAAVVIDFEGKSCVGLFIPTDQPQIIAVTVPGESPAEAVHTFLHEFAHYEQFRDGRPLTERGVNVRANNLMRQLGFGEVR